MKRHAARESQKFAVRWFRVMPGSPALPFLLIIFLLAGPLAGASCGQSASGPVSGGQSAVVSSYSQGPKWQAGYACCDIAVDLHDDQADYMAGYQSGKAATGILDHQKARAVFLDDQSGAGGILLISIDCIGLSAADVAVMTASLDPLIRSGGIRAVHIMATHTHAGVDTLGLWGPPAIGGKSELFMQALFSAAVTAATEAYANRTSGCLYTGSAEVDDLQQDSRLPQIYSKTVTVIRFVPEQGQAGIRLVNFAAHPEALRSRNTLISADYPYYMAEKIKAVSGDETFFTVGAIGGLISTRRLADERGAELNVIDNVKKTGEILADAVLAIDHERLLQPSLYTAGIAVRIDLDNPVFIALRFLGAISTRAVAGSGTYGLAIQTRVSLLVLDDLEILLVPGELFPELVYGSDFTGANPQAIDPAPLADLYGQDLVVFGLSDDEIGYIIPPSDFLIDPDQPCLVQAVDSFGRKHYEETNSVGIGAAPAIAEAAEQLYRAYRNTTGE